MTSTLRQDCAEDRADRGDQTLVGVERGDDDRDPLRFVDRRRLGGDGQPVERRAARRLGLRACGHGFGMSRWKAASQGATGRRRTGERIGHVDLQVGAHGRAYLPVRPQQLPSRCGAPPREGELGVQTLVRAGQRRRPRARPGSVRRCPARPSGPRAACPAARASARARPARAAGPACRRSTQPPHVAVRAAPSSSSYVPGLTQRRAGQQQPHVQRADPDRRGRHGPSARGTGRPSGSRRADRLVPPCGNRPSSYARDVARQRRRRAVR